MSIVRMLSGAALAAASACLSVAAAPALPAWPPTAPDLAADGGLRFGRLDNGLRYVLAPNATPPGRLSLRLLVSAGSLAESERERGHAHFLEHMVFQGTLHFPAGALVEYFQRLGMAFGADTNASTGFAHTVYAFDLPDAGDAALADALRLVRDIAVGVRLNSRAIDRERGVILAERRSRDTPLYRAGVAELSFLLPDSRHVRRTVIGEAADIQAASRASLLDFYRRWYRPDRLVLVIAGDVSATGAEAAIRRELHALEGSAPPDPPAPAPIPRGTRAAAWSDPDLPVTGLRLRSLVHHAAGDGRGARLRRMQLDMVHDALGRRLRTLARAPGAPHREALAGYARLVPGVDSATVVLNGEAGEWAGMTALAERELRRALLHGFTDGELSEQRERLLREHQEAAAAAGTRPSPALADWLVARVLGDEVPVHPDTALAVAREAVAGFDAARASALLNAVWRRGNRQLFLAGPLPAGVDDALLLQRHAASALAGVTAPVNRQPPPFAYAFGDMPGEVRAARTQSRLALEQRVFANGLRLNLRRSDYDAGHVWVRLRFGGGRRTLPPGSPGLAAVAERAFLTMGLREHTMHDLATLNAGRSVGGTFRVEHDAFVLEARTRPADLRHQLALFAAYLQYPGWRDEGLRMARRQLEADWQRARHTLAGLMEGVVARHLRGGDPRFGLPDTAATEALRMPALAVWLAPALAHGALELTVVGDTPVDTAIAAAAHTLGALAKRREPAPHPEAPPGLPAAGEVHRFDYRAAESRALALLAWPAPDRGDAVRRYQLLVLAALLEERLRVSLRESRGDGYDYEARWHTEPGSSDWGLLLALAVSRPQAAAAAAAHLRELALALARDGPGADELARALAPLREHLARALTDNRWWLEHLSAAQRHPRGLAWIALAHAPPEPSAATLGALARELMARAAATVLVLPADGSP